MTDQELLKLAAKAAGINIAQGSRIAIDGKLWSPLTDDGDALRLAVKLHMTVRCYMGNTCAQSTVPGGPNAYIDEMNMADPCAATRRAIVRAAAEIGKAMP